ncbi:MAG: EamA family transporter [Trueperaceae bacterium]
MNPFVRVGTLLVTALLFGANFTFMKIAVPEFGPLTLIGMRLLVATELLALVALATRRRLAFPGRWWDWFVFGGLQAAVPFSLAAWAELGISSSLAAILMATMPLFTAVFTAAWIREPLARNVVGGTFLGLVGVAFLVGWDGLAGGSPMRVLAMLLAAASYGLGAVYAKRRLASADALSLTVGNCGAAGILLLPGMVATAPAAMPSLGAFGALAGLTVLGTVLAFGLYFWLLARSTAVTASATAYLIPAFGALLGTLLLDERFTANMIVGVGLILVSLALVTGIRLPGARRALGPFVRALRPKRVETT